MELPLSKREWKLFYEVKQMFLNERNQAFSSTEYNRYDEWLTLLFAKDVLIEVRANGATLYSLRTPFDEFELWLKDQDKKAKRGSKREWRIGIVSAIIGAITGSVAPILIQSLLR